MSNEIYIAREDTLLDVKTEVKGGAKEATLNAVGVAVEKQANEIAEKIGTPTDTTENTVFGKFKTDLNSTIGTEDEKPLDFLSKNVLAADGYFYKLKMDCELINDIASPIGQEYLYGSLMDIDYVHRFIYCIKDCGSSTYCPACLSLDNIGSSNFAHYNNTYTYGLSSNYIHSIVCDDTGDAVFYAGQPYGEGAPIIARYTYTLGSRTTTVPAQSTASLILCSNGYLYDMFGTTIKKYNASNLSLVGTYSIPNVTYFYKGFIKGNYLYAHVALNGVTTFVKVDINTFQVVAQLIGSKYGFGFLYPLANDDEYIYLNVYYASTALYAFIKVRMTDLSIVFSIPTGNSLRAFGGGHNENHSGIASHFVVFTSALRDSFILLDKENGATTTIKTTNTGVLCYEDFLYYYNLSARMARANIGFKHNGKYERVVE